MKHGFCRALILLTAFSVQNNSLNADKPVDAQSTITEEAEFSLPVQVTAREGVAELKSGAKLWYQDTGGQGPVVIFIHAATMSGAAWPYQQPVFARAGYRVICYSRRCYYKSSSVGTDLGYASKDLLELMDYLAIKKTHIVAAAHGGSFATDFVLSYPDKVESLVLVSSLIGIDEPEYNAMLRRILPPFFRNLPPDFKELSPSYRASHPAGVKAWNQLAAQARNKDAYGTPKRQNRVTWERLRSIKIPVLLLGGEADLYAPPPLLKLQAENLPTAKTTFLPEVGHSAYWEAPSAFNRIVLKFLVESR